MKAVKIILNIFGILLAVILSIVLFASLIATPVVSAATKLISPNTINQVIDEIDFEVILENSIPEESESAIPKEVISKVFETQAAKDFIITLYTSEISAAFKGDVTEGITADQIKQIFNDNIDEITDIMYQYVPKGENISKEELKTNLTQELDVLSDDLAKQLPDVNQLIGEGNDNELIQTASFVFSGTLLNAFIFACVILSGLIYALRFPRFKGFMWLGVVYLLATLVVLAIGIAGSSVSSVSALLLESIPAEMLGIVTPIISVIFSKITNGGLALLGLAALFIAAFILCRIFIVKKKKAAKAEENITPEEVLPANE